MSVHEDTQDFIILTVKMLHPNLSPLLLCVTLRGIVYLRENPHSECHANVEGKGWKKAPPCCCRTSLNTEGNQSTYSIGAAVGGDAMSGTPGWGTPDLSFHLHAVSLRHLCITRQCRRELWEGWGECELVKYTVGKVKHRECYRMDLGITLYVSVWERKRN